MKTLQAFVKGARLAYLALLGGAAAVFLIPGLGYEAIAKSFGGVDPLHRIAVGIALMACCWEFARSTILMRNQAYLARRLMHASPDLRKLEAVRILIPALNSDSESVVGTARAELKRITGVDHGTDVSAWRRWLRSQERHPDPHSNDAGSTKPERQTTE